MLDKIEKMRKKSRAERQRMTVFLSIGITAVVALIWGTAILPRVFTLNNSENSRADATSPFKVFTESLGFIADDARKGWTDVMDVFQGSDAENESADESESDPTNGSVQNSLLEKGLLDEDFSRADGSEAEPEADLVEKEDVEPIEKKESEESALEDEGQVLPENEVGSE